MQEFQREELVNFSRIVAGALHMAMDNGFDGGRVEIGTLQRP